VPGEGSKPDKWYHASTVAPPAFMAQFCERKQYIGQLELLAAVAVYYSLPSLFIDRHIIHWVDNTSAVAGLIRGYSGVPDSARIVHAFWALAAALGLDVWFEYVPSEANIADAPSRGDCSYLHELGSVDCAFILSPIDAWRSPDEAMSAASVLAAQHLTSAAGRRRRRSISSE
jgi:hypothetical protein